jgi:mono/diheme cytochrome c family protein/uncharacterized membrane protein
MRVVFTTISFCIFAAVAHSQNVAEPATPSSTFWLWNFFSRLHPLTVHFPLTLLLVAAILELFTLKKFSSALRPGIRVLVNAGAVTAIVAAVMGLLLARGGDYGKTTLAIHQYAGLATAALGTAAFFLLRRIKHRQAPAHVKLYRAVLFATAIGVSVAGHYGGSLTHGSDYLTETLPWSNDYKPVITNSLDMAALQSDSGKLNLTQERDLNVQVRAIFAHNCYKCHGPDKVKGDLRLDIRDLIFKGGEHGPVLVAGKAGESELIKRITLPANDKKAMPSKEKRLSAAEIDILKLWIQKGAPWPENSANDVLFQVAKLQPRNPPLPTAVAGITNPVDLWVNKYFEEKKIQRGPRVDDRTYLRRIYLDIIGLLPTTEETTSFILDGRPGKRAIRVRELLMRDDDYATHWLSFWNDALRNDYTGTGYITGGRYNITDWLYKSLKSNKPYNTFVQELISPTKESKGFIAGIKWRGVINASQKTEMQAAQNVSQVFLGLNLKCASCHNSFVSNWKLTDAYAFANIFADSSLEINRCDKPTGKYTSPAMLWKELGVIDSSAKSAVKTKQLAEQITRPGNGRLYRTIVNRIWAQLMGRGLVEPVDVMDNQPWSQDLLDWLAYDFVENKYDLKELIYLIATSDTYQLPSVGIKDPNKITAQDFVFRGMLRKRMSAEQFTDAVSHIVEPVFGDTLMGYNPYLKSAAAAKPVFTRASLVVNNPFLIALGRPTRETVSTGRESQANLLQALELTKGERFNDALRKGAEKWLAKYRKSDEIIAELYREAFNRPPAAKEFAAARRALGAQPTVEAVQDLFWAIVLLPEFQLIY